MCWENLVICWETESHTDRESQDLVAKVVTKPTQNWTFKHALVHLSPDWNGPYLTSMSAIFTLILHPNIEIKLKGVQYYLWFDSYCSVPFSISTCDMMYQKKNCQNTIWKKREERNQTNAKRLASHLFI